MKKFLIIIFSLSFVLFLFIFAVLYREKDKNVNVITNKSEYISGEFISLKIENNSNNRICFSSCNPYFLEILEYDLWEKENYVGCNSNNIIDLCLKPREIKAFELEIDFQLVPGIYKVSIPYCFTCKLGNFFREENIVYSNIFEVK